jgi:hypothetical protein
MYKNIIFSLKYVVNNIVGLEYYLFLDLFLYHIT